MRQRKEDIPILVQHFIDKYNHRFQLNVPGMTEGVEQLFQKYEWPGNVRELEHMVEGAMNLIYYDEEIDYSHLPIHVRTKFPIPTAQSYKLESVNVPNTPSQKPLQVYLNEVEKGYIEQILKHHNGNVTQTAHKLGLSRQSLQYRINKYEIKNQKDK